MNGEPSMFTDFEEMLDSERVMQVNRNCPSLSVTSQMVFKKGQDHQVYVTYSNGSTEIFHITELAGKSLQFDDPQLYIKLKRFLEISLASEGFETYTCSLCTKKFDDEWEAIAHLNIAHPKEIEYKNSLQINPAAVTEIVKFKCKQCRKSYSNAKALRVHLKNSHRCQKKYTNGIEKFKERSHCVR